jgi:hypothetical protein
MARVSEGPGSKAVDARSPSHEGRNSLLLIIIVAFVVAHGLVHLLYSGQSWRLFQLQPGLVWPEGSWAFSTLLGDEATRLLASVACVLATIGFVAGGTGMLLSQSWWPPVVASSAAFSAVIFILFWGGGMQKPDQKGGIGLLINAAILAAVLTLR